MLIYKDNNLYKNVLLWEYIIKEIKMINTLKKFGYAFLISCNIMAVILFTSLFVVQFENVAVFIFGLIIDMGNIIALCFNIECYIKVVKEK